MKTILQIIPSLGAGGAEQGCIDVAGAIVESGARSIVISNGGERAHEITRCGATHIDLPVHSKNPFVMWRNVSKIKKIIAEYNVDIVHARSRAPAWSAYYATKDSHARFMTTCHAPYNSQNSTKRLYNSVMTKGQAIIAISEYVAKDIIKQYGADPSKITVVPRGVAIERFHPTAVTAARMIALQESWRVPDGANIILLPGRLTRWKGHGVLIDAMAMLSRGDVFAVITGDDQGRAKYAAELEAAIIEKGLSGKIRIAGHCSDMPAAYALASVALCPSTQPEGFGRVPVEAGAMGRPIIATNHGGAAETVLAGQTGWLIPPDDATALARAINEALDLSLHSRAVLGTKAMAHVAANFTRETMVEQTLGVYRKLCS